MLPNIAIRCSCTLSLLKRFNRVGLSVKMMSSEAVQRKSTKISEYLTLNQYHPNVTARGTTPTVLFLPWITATSKSAQRFEDLYGQRGFNVVTVWSKMKLFVWPKTCFPVANAVIDYLRSEVDGGIVVHAMSIGAYVYAMTLLAAAKDEARHSYLKEHIKGNVFDSIVYGGTRFMAVGMSKLVSDKVFIEKLMTFGLLSFLRLTKTHTEDILNASIEAFKNNHYLPSALLMYTTIDPMSDEKMVEEMGKSWQQSGVHVHIKQWTDSGHAELFRSHSEDYVAAVDGYLEVIKPTLGNSLSSKL